MFERVFLSCAVVLLPLNAALAQSKPDDVERCVGPMCMLTPIYRLGQTLMPAETPKPAAPVTALPAPTPNQAQDSAPQAGEVVQESGSQAPGNADSRQGTSADDVVSASQDSTKASDGAPSGPAHRVFSHGRKPPANFNVHVPNYATRRSLRPRLANEKIEPVTILADDPERDQIRELASVVKTPPIAIIPASEGVDACTHKRADFVVDTLQDPARLGPAIPLFSESLIVVARNVTGIRNLAGKHVSFGTPSGSSERTAQRLFRFLGINVVNTPLDTDNALDALASGDLDAVAFLAPRGYTGLINNDPTLHLLSLDADMVPSEGLNVSRIDPAAYLGASWPRKHVEVITVDAVLSLNPKASHDRSAMSLYAALDRKAAVLARNGFNLIGGEPVVTMRSVAKDDDPRQGRADPRRSAFLPDGC